MIKSLNICYNCRFKTDFEESWAGIKKHLLKYTHPSKMAFVGALGSMHASASFRNEMVMLSHEYVSFYSICSQYRHIFCKISVYKENLNILI